MRQGLPFFSIVMPCYNSEIYIEESLLSVINQTYPNFELIVADGGSSDSTISILERYNQDLVYFSSRDEGMYDAINKALRLAKGDIIAYLNSDDLYYRDTLKIVADYIARYSLLGSNFLIYSDLDIIDENSRFRYRHVYPTANLHHLLACQHSLIGQPSTMWCRSIHSDLGIWFDTSYKMAADYDFYIKLLKQFIPVHKLKQPIALFRIHKSSLSATQQSLNLQELKRIKGSYRESLSLALSVSYRISISIYYFRNFINKFLAFWASSSW